MNSQHGYARIELLTKDNFDTWKLQVRAVLVKNDAWGYVNGTKIKPSTNEADAATMAAAAAWDAADSKAHSELILAISPSELIQVKNCATSNDIWTRLHEIYQSQGPARKATLLKRLTLHKMADDGDMREHIRSFFDTVSKLQEMEVDINKDLLAIMLLYSLPPSYENFRCAIESRDELPTSDALKIKIMEENDARRATSKEKCQNALIVQKPRRQTKGANNQGETKKSEHRPPKFICFKCRKPGHKAAECRTKTLPTEQQAAKAREVSFATEAGNKESQTTTHATSGTRWCLDSGSTSHMCGNSEKFERMAEPRQRLLNLASNANTSIDGTGPVKIIQFKMKTTREVLI